MSERIGIIIKKPNRDGKRFAITNSKERDALDPTENTTKVDFFAFGTRSGPRAPRPGVDYVVDGMGMVGPEKPPFPVGASLFADPWQYSGRKP